MSPTQPSTLFPALPTSHDIVYSPSGVLIASLWGIHTKSATLLPSDPRPSPGRPTCLTVTASAIGRDGVAIVAGALEAARSVGADLSTSVSVCGTFVNICMTMEREGEQSDREREKNREREKLHFKGNS